MAGKVAALAAGGGIPSVFAVDAATTWVNLGVATYLANRALRELAPPTSGAPRSMRPVIRFAAISSITILVTFVVWRRTELFFLQWYSTPTEVAIYSIPFSVMAGLLLIPTALAQVVLPAFATLFGAQAMARIRVGYGRAVRVSTVFTLPVTALAFAIGPTLLTLVWGNEFEGSGDILRILLATFPVIPIMDMSQALLIGLGKRWAQVIIGSIAAVVNVGLDFVLIRAHGAIGAAVANSSAQLIGAVPIIIYANRTIGWAEWHFFAIVRSAAAAVASGGAALLVLSFLPGLPGLILGTLAGSVSFVLLAALLRILPGEDAIWLEQTIGGSVGGAVGRAVRYVLRYPSPEASNRFVG
jgi:O-antigen/teichoic acid export membrane protein